MCAPGEVYQTRKGVLRGRESRFSCRRAALIAILDSGFTASLYHLLAARLRDWDLPGAVRLLSVFVPRAVKSHAQEVFRSNRLLGLSDRVEIYRTASLCK